MNDSQPSYNRQSGATASRSTLLQYLSASYQEQGLQPSRSYLSQFVEQFLGDDHWVWWASCPNQPQPVGCLWVGYTIDPVTGDRHPYIFLLHVVPAYRRRGIGHALVTQVESWAKQSGYGKLSLHVFCQNEAGQRLYQQLNYHPQSTLMEKTL